MKDDKIYFFETVELDIEDFPATGYILDVGGGGEGMIGRLKGADVVSIDCREDELMEAPDGPLKIVMDARQLRFLSGTFSAATAFFSFMYFDKTDDILSALAEIYRVLKTGGVFHLWDVNIKQLPETEKEVFAVRLKCSVKGQFCETAYGRPWPREKRDIEYYRRLMEGQGFEHVNTEATGCTFHSCYRKLQGRPG